MIRVLVISDVRLYREGMARMLSRDGQLEVAGMAPSAEEAVRLLAREDAGVALVDVGMAEGLAVVRAIADSGQTVKVIALGISETPGDVLRCARAGAHGYVCRESSLDDLVQAVLSATEGELQCPPKIAAALLDGVARSANAGGAAETLRLTARELEVAELIDAGLRNHEIADRLHIAVPTVKVHVHNLLEKLSVPHRGAAVARLRRRGLIGQTPPKGSSVSERISVPGRRQTGHVQTKLRH